MRFKYYIVVTASDIESIEQRVNTEIQKGYTPHGPLMFTPKGNLAQPMLLIVGGNIDE